jgi:hypothetical protein
VRQPTECEDVSREAEGRSPLKAVAKQRSEDGDRTLVCVCDRDF